MNDVSSNYPPDSFRHPSVPAPTVRDLLDEVVAMRPEEAIPVYQRWIINQGPENPKTCPAWFNLGVALSSAGQLEKATACFEAALKLRADFFPAAINLGMAHERRGHIDDALSTWRSALQADSVRTGLLNQIGRLEETVGRLADAERDLFSSLLVNPDQPDVVQHWVHLRQRLCAWPVIPSGIRGLDTSLVMQMTGPLAALALTDDVVTQVDVGARWLARKTTPATPLSPPSGYDHERIRVGYMSSDFCRHAMSYLIADLFERHDRRRFEIFGYCASRDDGSDIRSRILSAFDKVTIIRDMSDAEAAQSIRDDEIDVLVDLNGLTAGGRLQVLRHKPAPVQATYLGFVGPVPLPELDYMFCDDVVVPPETRARYAPAPLAVGRLYQANDPRREIGAETSRIAVGLPEDRFLMCCFSNLYKITPGLFKSWIAILRHAPGSVLWLADDGTDGVASLREHAQAAGIDAQRLIFTSRVGPQEYLARLRLADLFLDTFPYNAGTVASDAIRMGVPLITRMGQSFASRMAGRLLLSVGATDGVCFSSDEYETKAIRLATEPDHHRQYAAHFTNAKWQEGPGNTAEFTREYERAIESIVKRPG